MFSLFSVSIMPPKTKIFVGKLPPTCKDFELRKLFERYGEVTECSILGNYAFVHMKTEDQAATAIKNLNNWDMNGFKISVEVRKLSCLRIYISNFSILFHVNNLDYMHVELYPHVNINSRHCLNPIF